MTQLCPKCLSELPIHNPGCVEAERLKLTMAYDALLISHVKLEKVYEAAKKFMNVDIHEWGEQEIADNELRQALEEVE